jgi:hypothetical protein
MQATRARFTIRWLMETTTIIAIALWLLRFSAETCVAILLLLTLYFFGLAPLRRLYGFAPIRRLFAGWARGYLPVNPENRPSDERRVPQGRPIVVADGRARDDVAGPGNGDPEMSVLGQAEREDPAMRRARIRFTIRSLMTVVAVSALVLAPFAWLPPESRWPLLIAVLTVGSMLLIVASPFLIDWLERRQKLRPRDVTVFSSDRIPLIHGTGLGSSGEPYPSRESGPRPASRPADLDVSPPRTV